MSHTNLRPCIVKLSVLGYFPLYVIHYFCFITNIISLPLHINLPIPLQNQPHKITLISFY